MLCTTGLQSRAAAPGCADPDPRRQARPAARAGQGRAQAPAPARGANKRQQSATSINKLQEGATRRGTVLNIAELS